MGATGSTFPRFEDGVMPVYFGLEVPEGKFGLTCIFDACVSPDGHDAGSEDHITNVRSM